MNAIMINSKSIRFDYTAAGAITAAAKATGYHESWRCRSSDRRNSAGAPRAARGG